jgi:hypothetical protein
LVHFGNTSGCDNADIFDKQSFKLGIFWAIALMMEAERTSETSVDIQLRTR